MQPLPLRIQFLGLAGWLAACFLIAALGATASVNAEGFYAQLAQPSWAPAAGVFGPVWSILYTMMALAAWLVWRNHGFAGAGFALGLFGIQLLANALWSWLFFEWHLGAYSFAEIILLWLLIIGTVAAFWRLHKGASLLLVPYLCWVTFASALTLAIWRLNPTILG